MPSEQHGGRISFSHVIVLDGLLDASLTQQLREFLVAEPVSSPPLENEMKKKDYGGGGSSSSSSINELPANKWERKTADMAGAAPTWGLRPHVLQQLACGQPPALIEVQSRLQLLFPEYKIAHLPCAAIQQPQQDIDDESEGEDEDEPHRARKKKKKIENEDDDAELPSSINDDEDEPHRARKKKKKLEKEDVELPSSINDDKAVNVDCSAFLANAAAVGDVFRFHVDADPTCFPPSDWTAAFGDYFNGEPGKPLLVTLLIYLNEQWERDWGGETLFLDSSTDAGVFVRPRAGRAVLMEQDVLHRVSPPSALANGQLRLSLVLKLVFLPNDEAAVGEGGEVRLAKREWGLSTAFGSAARVEAVKRQLAAERRSQI